MTETKKTSIHGLLPGELAAVCAEMGEPAFRARQVWKWLYIQRVGDWGQMTNVPAALREKLRRLL